MMKPRHTRMSVVLLVVVGMVGRAGAQPVPPDANVDSRWRAPEEPPRAPDSEPLDELVVAQPSDSDTRSLSPMLLETTREALAAQGRYDVFRFDHARATYRTQQIQTWIIFVVVLVVFGFGIFASWVYFRDGSRPGITTAKTPPLPAGEEEAPETHNLQVGPTGLTISTRALGVVVLAMSLAFFYLYLRYVYPIQETSVAEPRPAQE
jgi:hypothetical protein